MRDKSRIAAGKRLKVAFPVLKSLVVAFRQQLNSSIQTLFKEFLGERENK